MATEGDNQIQEAPAAALDPTTATSGGSGLSLAVDTAAPSQSPSGLVFPNTPDMTPNAQKKRLRVKSLFTQVQYSCTVYSCTATTSSLHC